MKQFSRIRALVGLTFALFCFLFLSASIISYQQQKILRNNTLREIKSDIDLMSDASLDALLKSDFVSVRNFINQWGGKRKEYRNLRVIAPNGYIIAEYNYSEADYGESFTISKEVAIGKLKLATIIVSGDYNETDKIVARIRSQIILVSLILTALLGMALWLIFRNTTIEPLEEAVNKRTKELLESNEALKQLTDNSPS